jgi:hypothetical protein
MYVTVPLGRKKKLTFRHLKATEENYRIRIVPKLKGTGTLIETFANICTAAKQTYFSIEKY